MSLVITHATGTRTIAAYTLPDWDRSYAIVVERPVGATSAVVFGDRKINPVPYSARVTVVGASLAAAMQLAFTIVEEANTASQVESYEGVLLVDGIVSASIEVADHSSVLVTLAFAASKAEFEP